MGIMRLEKYLEKDVPNGYCSRVSIQDLAQKYQEDTGKVPVMIVDGAYCLRTVYKEMRHEWFLGGQLKEFVAALKQFVGAFENIGVRLMFFFDGATQEKKRHTWILRKEQQLQKVAILFQNLRNGFKDDNQDFLLPPLVGAIGRFIAKYECHCDVQVSTQECDSEMADFAWRHHCFAILSRDTDFVLLREALLKSLSLEDHEFLLVASLLGNDVIPWRKVLHFHKKLCRNDCNDIFSVLPSVVNYIKNKNIPKDYNFEYLEDIAVDIFNDKDMANSIEESIKSYLPPAENKLQQNDDVIEIQKWEEILEMVAQKHLTCCLTTHLYPVMLGEAYELAVAIEDFTDRHWKPASKIYFPLRKRIYGLLLFEKSDAMVVKEWCIDNNKCPKKPRRVPISHIDNIEVLHPGLLKLWSDGCDAAVRWQLFSECLTANQKIDAVQLQNLGFPLAVPVAVLYYLVQVLKTGVIGCGDQCISDHATPPLNPLYGGSRTVGLGPLLAFVPLMTMLQN
ncbi:hypothetical protein C0J52_23309 [Blattella germanica]|nr:hypothetical protein C0J52_23309 [Blattella germanica]